MGKKTTYRKVPSMMPCVDGRVEIIKENGEEIGIRITTKTCTGKTKQRERLYGQLVDRKVTIK